MGQGQGLVLSSNISRMISHMKFNISADATNIGHLVGYLTPSHVTHQRLLLQFLSAPEDGHKKRPKHVEQYCSYK